MIETVREAIDALGGTARVAERYSVKPSAVSNWRVWNRFPARLHYRISRDAAELGIELSPALFDAPSASTAPSESDPSAALSSTGAVATNKNAA